VAFSVSKPFRKPIYTNYLFTLNLLLIIGACLFIVLADFPWLLDLWPIQEKGMSMEFKLYLLAGILVNFLISYIVEKLGIWYLSLWWKRK
jgi:cation-transporting ATPase 13A3/4/5